MGRFLTTVDVVLREYDNCLSNWVLNMFRQYLGKRMLKTSDCKKQGGSARAPRALSPESTSAYILNCTMLYSIFKIYCLGIGEDCTVWLIQEIIIIIVINFPLVIYLFKFSNRNTRTRCEICSKLRIRTSKQRRRSDVYLLNFEQFSHHVLVFLWLTLNK